MIQFEIFYGNTELTTPLNEKLNMKNYYWDFVLSIFYNGAYT